PALGIPPQSLGPRPHSPGAAVRDMTLGSDGKVAGRGVAEFEGRGMLAVLLTTGDAAVDWVRGGMALERVLLTATVLGLSTGILSHGTEVVDLRPLVRDPSSRWRHPQVVVRFGHGDAMPATPRLPVSEVLELR
ncbi:MAG TPA: nitroreductase, partial [Actinomycetes bacterium]